MAIIDLQTKFSDVQAVTVTAVSANILDLRNFNTGVTTPALADESLVGANMWVTIFVGTAVTAAGAATVTFSLESDSTTDLATSPTVHYVSAAIGKATLVAGYAAVRVQLPSGDYERYLGVRYTVATGPLTAGTFTAFLHPNVQRNITYPNGFVVG
jgi:hypothetical protein